MDTTEATVSTGPPGRLLVIDLRCTYGTYCPAQEIFEISRSQWRGKANPTLQCHAVAALIGLATGPRTSHSAGERHGLSQQAWAYCCLRLCEIQRMRCRWRAPKAFSSSGWCLSMSGTHMDILADELLSAVENNIGRRGIKGAAWSSHLLLLVRAPVRCQWRCGKAHGAAPVWRQAR
jgi:hypothetical protein